VVVLVIRCAGLFLCHIVQGDRVDHGDASSMIGNHVACVSQLSRQPQHMLLVLGYTLLGW